MDFAGLLNPAAPPPCLSTMIEAIPNKLIALAIASLVSLSASAAAPRSVHGARDARTEVCEDDGREDSCIEVSSAQSNADLVDISRVNVGLRGAASWIETREYGYQLCSVSAAYESRCIRMKMPRLNLTRLMVGSAPGNKTSLKILFPTVGSRTTVEQRRAIRRTFRDALDAAAGELNDQLNAGRSQVARQRRGASGAASDNYPITTKLISVEYCDDFGCGGDDDGGDDVGGGGDVGDGVGGYRGNPFGNVDASCVEECTGAYDGEAEFCAGLGAPQLRAICYASAMVAYGACLALC